MGSNPAYTTTELNHLFRVTGVQYIISEPTFLENVLSSAKECQIPHSNIFAFSTDDQQYYAGCKSWEALLEYGEEDWMRLEGEEKVKKTTAALMSTSGTTGLPKAAEVSHYAQVAQSIMMYDSEDKTYQASPQPFPP